MQFLSLKLMLPLWLPTILLLGIVISRYTKRSLWWIEQLIFIASLLSAALIWLWICLKIRKLKRPSPSLLAGLIELAAMKRLDFPALLFATLVLLGHLVSLISKTNFVDLLKGTATKGRGSTLWQKANLGMYCFPCSIAHHRSLKGS